MLRFAKKNVTPPGSYRYQDPDTNQYFEAPHMMKLASDVRKHRTANKLELPDDLSAVIEDWMCRHLPSGICRDEHGRMASSGIHYYTAETSVRQTSIAVRIMRAAKRNPVKIEDAENRAILCVACEYNLPMAGCMSCRGVKDIIDGMRHGKNTSQDLLLQVCGFLVY